jgi:AmmeMemoRadiSam system protein B
MPVREPAVAGMFYPSDKNELETLVEYCFLGPGGPGKLPQARAGGPRRINGLVSPHAGLIYSGSVAAWAYGRLAEDGVPDVAVIIGPNHRAWHPAAALSDDSAWKTPLGEVPLNIDIARHIAGRVEGAGIDPRAHASEHSLEVQLPFLQYISRLAGVRTSIVPVLLGAAETDTPDFIRELGGAIAEAVRGQSAVVIASTDFTHYEQAEEAKEKDSKAIERILHMDETGLIQTAVSLDLSMCGVVPTAATLAACKNLGATSAELLAYRNSGDVTGDYSEVVGYASLLVK